MWTVIGIFSVRRSTRSEGVGGLYINTSHRHGLNVREGFLRHRGNNTGQNMWRLQYVREGKLTEQKEQRAMAGQKTQGNRAGAESGWKTQTERTDGKRVGRAGREQTENG